MCLNLVIKPAIYPEREYADDGGPRRSSMETSTIIDTILEFYDINNQDIETFAALNSLTEIVTAVCVQKRSLVFSDAEIRSGYPRVDALGA
jgi:hypothetical protein